jgi:hypothetical protein
MRNFKFFQKTQLKWFNPDENHVVIGVTPMMYNPHTFTPSKCILYRNITTNETIKGEVIYEGHAYWNYNE